MNIRENSKFDSIMSFAGVAGIAEDPSAIEVHLSMTSKLPQYVAIRQFFIYHKEDLQEIIFNHISVFPEFDQLNKSFPVYKLGINNGERNITGVLAIIPGTTNNISRIITVSFSSFWNMIVRRIVRRIYPRAMPVFFKQKEIGAGLLSLESSLPNGYSIHLSDVTSREERIITGNTKRNEYDTRRLWTDTPWKDVFSTAQESGEWFTGLKFSIQRERNTGKPHPIASGRIYKQGEIHYDFYHELISQTVIKTLEKYAHERLTLLEERGIRERNYNPGSPIEIAFDFDAFNKVEDIRQFGEIITRYPHSTKAVYHSNPYYHASVADTLDGSSFDMWVLSQNKIVVIPQAKSSAQAFERLISFVFSEFNEGTVNIYEDSE
jgi:hypothetical protein